MKPLKTPAITLAISLLSLSAPVWAGGSDGGGMGFSSTSAEVDAAVKNLKNEMLRITSHARVLQALNPDQVADSEVKAVLNAMARQPQNGKYDSSDGSQLWSGDELYSDVNKTAYQAKEVCTEGQAVRDASTQFRRGAPICVNRKTLTRYPSDELRLELIALAFHEHAHHFGFPEDVAEKFQAYMKRVTRNILLNEDTSLGSNELRLGGTGEFVKKGGEKFKIKCIPGKELRSIIHREDGPKYPADTLLIEPEKTLVFQGENVLEQVLCRSLPAAKCSIQREKNAVGRDYLNVWIGDFRAAVDAPNPQKTLLDWEKKGICRSEQGSENDGKSDPAGIALDAR